jgi:hypothetical protein
VENAHGNGNVMNQKLWTVTNSSSTLLISC